MSYNLPLSPFKLSISRLSLTCKGRWRRPGSRRYLASALRLRRLRNRSAPDRKVYQAAREEPKFNSKGYLWFQTLELPCQTVENSRPHPWFGQVCNRFESLKNQQDVAQWTTLASTLQLLVRKNTRELDTAGLSERCNVKLNGGRPMSLRATPRRGRFP